MDSGVDVNESFAIFVKVCSFAAANRSRDVVARLIVRFRPRVVRRRNKPRGVASLGSFDAVQGEKGVVCRDEHRYETDMVEATTTRYYQRHGIARVQETSRRCGIADYLHGGQLGL